MSERTYILTPVGRLLWGHPMVAQPQTDPRTKVPKLDKQNKPIVVYSFGIGFPKSDPAFARDVYAVMQQVAQRDFPKGEHAFRDFAWKVKDGDGVDAKNKPYSDRDGWAGHYVLSVSSTFQPQMIDPNQTPITDAKAIKTGDYVRAYVNVTGNDSTQSPGLYINPQFVQLCGYGAAIVSGPDVSSVLATAAPIVLPAGATSMPQVAALPGLPAAGPVPAPALPGMAAVPVIPGLPAAPTAPAVFPPAGWTAHPTSPGWFYKDQEVKTEAELRGQVVPVPAILGR